MQWKEQELWWSMWVWLCNFSFPLHVWGPTGPEVLSVRVLLSGHTPTGRQPGSLG